MSQVPTETFSPPAGGSSASASMREKSPKSVSQSGSTPAPKLRSCVVCRSRKVRCDKLLPCSNCRRASIACVSSSAERPPRWARRLERVANTAASSAKETQDANPDVGKVMERLRDLENLVKDLSSQLAEANGTASSSPHLRDNTEHHMDVSSSVSNTTGVQKQFGRLVLQGENRSRYVDNGFWSRVSDEIDDLRMNHGGLASDDSNTSEDEDSPGKTPSTQELDRPPSERHAFLFRHNLSPSNPSLRDLHPLPSQIPFLLHVYSENVNRLIQIVHIPTITKMVRDMRGSDMNSLTPANEALMFSIYYAAVTSMEEDDIMADFGCTKADLNLKYRLGLEHALAKADFLNVPDIVLVQAFAIFLFLVRRHDSPRFVWMMTGLVIRMAQALGLHRDGSHFDHLTPYEVEIRRRIWWAVCILDLRSSEDQGMELSITNGSFDTKFPLNINDADIDPQTKQTPRERESLTDMIFTFFSIEMCHATRRLLFSTAGEGAARPEEQLHLLKEVYEKIDRTYLQYSTELENSVWVAVTSTRLVMAKMTLFVYLPVLFSSPSEDLSDEIRTKLLVSALEVAEYNHSLNSEKACRHWRWIFQTYTHWYAIVYLLIEITRRPWSAIVERAWVALHSSWLIPVQSKTDKNLRIWFPLRKLMTKARKHRETELTRLREDGRAAAQLEKEDSKIPLPTNSGPFPVGNSYDLFREHWRKLVATPQHTGHGSEPWRAPTTAITSPLGVVNGLGSMPVYGNSDLSTNSNFEPAYLANTNTAVMVNPQTAQTDDLNALPTVDWSGDQMWPETDMSMDVGMDLDAGIDWYNWVESAKGIERNLGTAGDSYS